MCHAHIRKYSTTWRGRCNIWIVWMPAGRSLHKGIYSILLRAQGIREMHLLSLLKWNCYWLQIMSFHSLLFTSELWSKFQVSSWSGSYLNFLFSLFSFSSSFSRPFRFFFLLFSHFHSLSSTSELWFKFQVSSSSRS